MFAKTTVRALLENLIDYAGMFPPARLPMAEALRHYTQLSAAPEAWMLGRFVCQASRLGELLELARSERAPRPLQVAVLGRGGSELGELRRNLDMDIVDIERLQTALGAKANVLELTLPPGPSAADVTGFLEQGLPGAELRTFLEVPHGSTWQGDVQTLCQRWGDLPGPPSPYRLGLKIRCGGAIVPTIEQVAFFIARCHENRVAWKATAGLHHPLRHRDPASQTMAHGFLNVFLAGIFTHVHSLDETQIAALLQEESVEAFRFSDEDITWRDWRCTIEQVREARAWMPSFGSCSVDEPRDDLRALRLID